MSWEAAGVLVALGVGFVGLILGILSLRRAGDANAIAGEAGTSSRQAVEKADMANRIARDSNAISREAVEHSRRSADAAERAVSIGDEANVLQRHGLQLEKTRHEAALSAELDVRFLVAHEASERFVFRIVNKGPQDAKKVKVIYRDGDHEEELVIGTDLRPGEELQPECTLGGLYGAGWITASPDDRVIGVFGPLGTQEGELHIAYRDGNGPQVLKKRVLWSEAPSFSERNISVEDCPEE